MKNLLITLYILLATTLIAKGQSGTWYGSIKIQNVTLPVVFHLDKEPTMDSPKQNAYGISIQFEATGQEQIIIKIPSIGAIFEGKWRDNLIVGNFTQMGMSFPLTLSKEAPKKNRPQTPTGPFPYIEEEVEFTNGSATLKGTLTLPQNYNRETPVLIMITGSGLQNRDEEIFEHKPFAVIADSFARKGIATLRYDDRGYGESIGNVTNCTTEDFKNDALAGISLLRKRFNKVGILGHSEGGTIAFMLGAENRADFIISLAGNVVSGGETLIWQNREILSSAGFSNEIVERYCNLLQKAFDALVNGNEPPTADAVDLPESLKQNYSGVIKQIVNPYMRYAISLDVRPLLNQIGCPVLALNGDRDKQVDATTNLSELRKFLPHNHSTRIESIQGVNHLFQHCSTGLPSEYEEIEETFSPKVLDLMIEWITSNI